jgi:hypothetical protein
MKIREIVGTDPVNPLTKEQLQAYSPSRYGSPAKQVRVDGYMHSNGMIKTLAYQDNDPNFGIVDVKP